VIMGKGLVPEARAWAMYLYIKDITREMVDMIDKVGKATAHRHDFDEVYLLIGDKDAITFEVMLGGETYMVSTPASVYIPRGLPHAISPQRATVGLTGGLIALVLNGEYTTLPA